MKLFTLKHLPSQKVLLDMCFTDKQQAKKARDKLNESAPGEYVVTYGPEHRKYRRVQ